MGNLITDTTDQELEKYRAAIVKEQERRRTLASAGKAMDDIARSVLAAQGVAEGTPWVQPTDATNAYPKDWELPHDGKEWVSLVSGNVWEPGVSGWREKVEEGAAPPDYIPPTGAHDAYQTGDRVTFEGEPWEAVMDGVVWSPTEYAQAWKRADDA